MIARRIPTFAAAALWMAALFLACHALGFRDHVSVLSGTMPDSGGEASVVSGLLSTTRQEPRIRTAKDAKDAKIIFFLGALGVLGGRALFVWGDGGSLFTFNRPLSPQNTAVSLFEIREQERPLFA